MASINVGVWGASKVGVPPDSIFNRYDDSYDAYDDSYDNSYDDGFDFLPTNYPVREIVTFSIFVLGVIALLIWGGSRLVLAIF